MELLFQALFTVQQKKKTLIWNLFLQFRNNREINSVPYCLLNPGNEGLRSKGRLVITRDMFFSKYTPNISNLSKDVECTWCKCLDTQHRIFSCRKTQFREGTMASNFQNMKISFHLLLCVSCRGDLQSHPEENI